jgi:hypothetical protein
MDKTPTQEKTLRLFNFAAVSILATFAIGIEVFQYQSDRADQWMRMDAAATLSARSPRLKALRINNGHHGHRTIKDTAENKVRWAWGVAPGDGYLYSAWWVR